MLLRQEILRRIADGAVTVAFRRWRRPTVKIGGTLKTAVGVLAIDSVEAIRPEDVSESDALAAGYDSREALLASLPDTPDDNLYRIGFHFAGADPRVALREQALESDHEWREVASRLDRLDRANRRGAWTRRTMRLIGNHPGVRARDLAALEGLETAKFKADLRKLKALGLTESLDVGYRLSPRGRSFLKREG